MGFGQRFQVPRAVCGSRRVAECVGDGRGWCLQSELAECGGAGLDGGDAECLDLCRMLLGLRFER